MIAVQPLKKFQEATVVAAITALSKKPHRFLVADEVGLGKTLVAQKIIEQLATKKRNGALVVFYVCSNLTIASQNGQKLLDILPEKADRKAARCREDRLTMLLSAPRPNKPGLKFHLYTLTPDTSIPIRTKSRRGYGKQEERAMITVLLEKLCPAGTDVGWLKMRELSSWDRYMQNSRTIVESNPTILTAFRSSLLQEFAVPTCKHLPKIFAAIRHSCVGKRQRFERLLVPRLRNALALAALREVQPDLVIFDEFQRYRDLVELELDQESRLLVERLRGDSHPTKLLLLSATPYRLYVRRGQKDSLHKEFYELVEFLHGKKGREVRAECEEKFAKLADLIRKGQWTSPQGRDIRDEIEILLTPVMARTERASHPQAADDCDTEEIKGELVIGDLQVFRHTWECFTANHKSAAVPYWYSIPLPIQTMGSKYVAWKAWKKGRHRVNCKGVPSLSKDERDRYGKIQLWPHARFRKLQHIVPRERLALPWISPTLPWWPLKGTWKDDKISKVLIFSRFRAVPPAISALMSYDLESSLCKGYGGYAAANKEKKFKPRASLLELFFPSPVLIEVAEPLAATPLTVAGAERIVARQLSEFVQRKGIKIITSRKRPRKLWSLLVGLEKEAGRWGDVGKAWKSFVTATTEPGLQKVFAQWESEAPLTEIARSEIKALAHLAISSPGVAVGRALHRHWTAATSTDNLGLLFSTVWQGLRNYLDQKLFVRALSRKGEDYPTTIQRVVLEGNLEATIDEYLWLLNKVNGKSDADLCHALWQSLNLHMGRSSMHALQRGGKEFQLRCHAAMPFADHDAGKLKEGAKSDEERSFRTDELRKAFNSPFWPHVLTTTSVGQEGLDFHLWCDTLVHWDLCGSPVDLEQREGRIQRFAGLAVRKSIGKHLQSEHSRFFQQRKSPWSEMARIADAHQSLQDESGLSPWWISEGAKLSRFVINLPASEETLRLQRLKEHKTLYRLVLGQPNQEDLVEILSRDEGIDTNSKTVRELMLCLSPFFRERRENNS